MNLESEHIMPPDPVQETQQEHQEESTDEIYSCNTCKVSFSSVIEHIQNYHNDQDVVVEVILYLVNGIKGPFTFYNLKN